MSELAVKSLLALALVACTSTRTTSPAPTPAPTEASAPTPAVEPSHTEHETAEADLMFIDMMIPHHQQAMQVAEMAQTRAQRPEVQEMASKMHADQQREVEKMKEWRSGWYADAPQAAMHEMHDMHGMSGTHGMPSMDMSGLQTAQGVPFDRMFVDMMIPHHEQALQMADQMRGKVVHAELGQLIEEMSATQRAEIATMRSWQESWAESPSN